MLHSIFALAAIQANIKRRKPKIKTDQTDKYKKKTKNTHPDLIRANKILKENAPEEFKFIFS